MNVYRSGGIYPEWINAELVRDRSARERSGALYSAYLAWCSSTGRPVCSHRAFSADLQRRGGVLSRDGKGRYVIGFRLASGAGLDTLGRV